jgi:AcrR family transcriptional regulator
MTATAARLLDATRACIADGGLGSATSREIATAAGTNLQAITYHFGSKDRLVARALVETVREWFAPALDVMREPGDPATQMLAAVQALTSHFEQRRADAPALLEALVAAPRLPELRTAVLDLWTGMRTELAGHIAALKAEGNLAAWVEPNAMATLLIAVANGLALQVTVDRLGPSMPELAAQFTGLLLEARSPAARASPPTG